MAARKLGIPCVAVVTGLGYAFANNNWLANIVIKLYRNALKNVHKVWLLNENDKEILLRIILLVQQE
uniref:CAZy families GT4 protein n=1 Tax=uncultured Ralstonia sp. TaxID=114715 RepID=A0A060CCR0_9RALS|nr:CAZy families GT4 protein [uncultured Ralstonia sp.]